MNKLFKKLRKAFAIPCVRHSAYIDTFYHTGFYRFVSCGEFKIDGIPCLTQKGEKEMVFFTETNLVGNKNVVPVKKHCA